MNTILLLGCSGFIGRNLMEQLLADESNILILLVRSEMSVPHFSDRQDRIVLVQGTLADEALIQSVILEYHVNTVLHLACGLIPSSSKEKFDHELQQVVKPTFNLIQFLEEKDILFVFFSSGGTIYGNTKIMYREDDERSPINYYGYSKQILEEFIGFRSRVSNLKYLILRPSNVYGKYQHFDGKQGFISVAINKIYHGEVLEIWGDGLTIRDYIHVSDLTDIVLFLLQERITNSILNISTAVDINLLEIVACVEKALGKKANISFKAKRTVDAQKVILDNTALTRIYHTPMLSIEKGIDLQVTYYKTLQTHGQ